MPDLIHQFISHRARTTPGASALQFKDESITYSDLQRQVSSAASALIALGIAAGERVAVYLPKQPEAIYGMFGAAAAGACFVPVNPLLKPRQVAYILAHCNVRVLITSSQRLAMLEEVLPDCPDLRTVVVVENQLPTPASNQARLTYPEFSATGGSGRSPHRRIDTDMAAILYTSGSTGNPKGVVLSHRNMVAGANSVASYLANTPDDRILAVLPLSFDAGLSQLTTAFSVGASAVLMDYLLPRDVIRAAARYRITGLAAVPPLWNQLVGLDWPAEAVQSLRYITNTGGAMPVPTTRALRKALPGTEIFLMYGLTEAFRSTYLPPDQVDTRPESMGKAIPNAEILVVNERGEVCGPGEPGELVCTAPFPSMPVSFWNDPDRSKYHAAYFAEYDNVWRRPESSQNARLYATFVVRRFGAPARPSARGPRSRRPPWPRRGLPAQTAPSPGPCAPGSGCAPPARCRTSARPSAPGPAVRRR